ncbi:hypothetical protein [Pedobacter soli]|uniref:hypothetical protein n=1 Tax=Pedobacter soli TaxID=390242 RepID=UPI00115FC36F|nr:hypothetical protein [Pedobacter soli]
MNNTPEPRGRNFNGKHYPKLRRIVTAPRKIIRTKLRGFLSLHLEQLIDTLPISQPINRRRPGYNNGI